KVGMVGMVGFEARIQALVATIPDLAMLVEPLLVVRRVLREQIVILHRRLLAIMRDDEVCRRQEAWASCATLARPAACNRFPWRGWFSNPCQPRLPWSALPSRRNVGSGSKPDIWTRSLDGVGQVERHSP